MENCICIDGRCAINVFYEEKLQVATIAGSTNYENGFNYGVFIASLSQCMLAAGRTEEEYFGVKILLEFGQAVNTTVSKYIWKQISKYYKPYTVLK